MLILLVGEGGRPCAEQRAAKREDDAKRTPLRTVKVSDDAQLHSRTHHRLYYTLVDMCYSPFWRSRLNQKSKEASQPATSRVD